MKNQNTNLVVVSLRKSFEKVASLLSDWQVTETLKPANSSTSVSFSPLSDKSHG